MTDSWVSWLQRIVDAMEMEIYRRRNEMVDADIQRR